MAVRAVRGGATGRHSGAARSTVRVHGPAQMKTGLSRLWPHLGDLGRGVDRYVLRWLCHEERRDAAAMAHSEDRGAIVGRKGSLQAYGSRAGPGLGAMSASTARVVIAARQIGVAWAVSGRRASSHVAKNVFVHLLCVCDSEATCSLSACSGGVRIRVMHGCAWELC